MPDYSSLLLDLLTDLSFSVDSSAEIL